MYFISAFRGAFFKVIGDRRRAVVTRKKFVIILLRSQYAVNDRIRRLKKSIQIVYNSIMINRRGNVNETIQKR